MVCVDVCPPAGSRTRAVSRAGPRPLCPAGLACCDGAEDSRRAARTKARRSEDRLARMSQPPSGPPETGSRLAASSARRSSTGGLDSQRDNFPGERMPKHQLSRRAETGARGRAGGRSRAPPYGGSPHTGWPIAARCARIWWVRPVSSRTRSSVVRGSRSSTSKWVTASRARSVRVDIDRAAAAVAADRGVDGAALGVRVARHERQVLARRPRARCIIRWSAAWASSDLRHHEQPGGVAVEAVDDARPARGRRRPPRGRRSASASVGPRWPGRGVGDDARRACRPPAGLVLVDDLERRRLRARGGARGRGAPRPPRRSPAADAVVLRPRARRRPSPRRASIRRCAAARDGGGAARGEEGVEAQPGVLGARRSARPRLVSASPPPPRAARARPTTMQASATLNAGQATGSMKSITAPSRARSARLPSAPPSSSPTGSHSQRHVAVAARSSRPAAPARAPIRTATIEPAALERAERHARVARVGEVEAEEDVHLVAARDVRVGELLGRLVERHDHARRWRAPRPGRRPAHPRMRPATMLLDDDQHEGGDDRAEVERAGAHPHRRQDAPEQVQVRVGHVGDELQERRRESGCRASAGSSS